MLERAADILMKANYNGIKEDHYDAFYTALYLTVPKNYETIPDIDR